MLYDQARVLVEQKKYIPARKVLTEIGTREAEDPKLDPLVKITTADSYYYQPGVENIIEAQSRYGQFVSFYPSHDLAAYAQFQLAMCDLKQSPIPDLDQTFTHKAIEELDKVSKIDTTGRWTAAAAQMKLVCMQKLATHDYQVGRFYYKRKIWAGAISRFKKLLESVPDYPQKDAVYFYLGASLVRAFQLTEGKIYLQKVVDDYPKSPYADRARRELAKST